MTTRRYEDELVTDFQRRMWPIIDVRGRIQRAARVAQRPEPLGRRRSA